MNYLNEDKAYEIVSKFCNTLEPKYGEGTHQETTYSGRVNFTFLCAFCTDDEVVTFFNIKYNLKTGKLTKSINLNP